MTGLRRGLAITDLLAIPAILLLVGALGVPTLNRAREFNKRMVCAVNLKALGGAAAVYADANDSEWMTPPFKRDYALDGVSYLCSDRNSNDIACVGFQRSIRSTSDTPLDPYGGSTAMSTTRAYWMLVRSGDVSVKQFICPSSQSDVPDPTVSTDIYYDFQEYENISYGYQVPFGPPDTRPRTGADNRIVFAADKGPFYRNNNLDFRTGGPGSTSLEEWHAPFYWRPFNSPNHGGQGKGEGQNALHADRHVEFCRKPTCGIEEDNLYTLMVDSWDVGPYNRTHGDSPHRSSPINPYPGKESLGVGANDYSTTDSLIYP